MRGTVTGDPPDRQRPPYLLTQLTLAVTALRWARHALELTRQGCRPMPSPIKAAVTSALSSITVAIGEIAHLQAQLEQGARKGTIPDNSSDGLS